MSKRRVADALLDQYPRAFAEELAIRRLEWPTPLFQLLVLSNERELLQEFK